MTKIREVGVGGETNRMREVDWKRKSQSVFGTAGRSEMRRRNRRKGRRELRKMKTKMG